MELYGITNYESVFVANTGLDFCKSIYKMQIWFVRVFARDGRLAGTFILLIQHNPMCIKPGVCFDAYGQVLQRIAIHIGHRNLIVDRCIKRKETAVDGRVYANQVRPDGLWERRDFFLWITANILDPNHLRCLVAAPVSVAPLCYVERPIWAQFHIHWTQKLDAREKRIDGMQIALFVEFDLLDPVAHPFVHQEGAVEVRRQCCRSVVGVGAKNGTSHRVDAAGAECGEVFRDAVCVPDHRRAGGRQFTGAGVVR